MPISAAHSGVASCHMFATVLLLYTGSLLEINLRDNLLTGSIPVALARLPIVVSECLQEVPAFNNPHALKASVTTLTRLRHSPVETYWLVAVLSKAVDLAGRISSDPVFVPLGLLQSWLVLAKPLACMSAAHNCPKAQNCSGIAA